MHLARSVVCHLRATPSKYNLHRTMASVKFLKQKALSNILVHFAQVPADQTKIVFENVSTTVAHIYGPNRFAVYNVDDNELRFDTKTLSAILLIFLASKDVASESVPRIDIPMLKLNIESLGVESFDEQFFTEQITRMIPIEDYQCNENEVDNDDGMYLFDTFNVLDKYSSSEVQHIDVKLNRLSQLKLPNFDVSLYFENLRTNNLGRSMVFAHKIPSTMDVADRYHAVNGLVAICNYQTRGIGRNDNKWLSPIGCVMFTINLNIPASSRLWHRLALVQHLASLSVILSIPSDQLNIRIKWPNDIVYGESMSKICGILARSTCQGSTINIQIGFGINLSNSYPSVCLNDIIDFHNTQSPSKLPHLEKEVLISNVLNNLEDLLTQLEHDQLQAIQELYCASWIHSGVEITIQYGDEHVKRAEITGIDDHGYLLARDLMNNQTLVLQPDGNRFDLMRHLVIIKSRD